MVAQRLQLDHPQTGDLQKRFRRLMKIFGLGEGDPSESQPGTATASDGVATAQAREIYGARLPVVADSQSVKYLIQVHTWTPISELRKAPAKFYCLDMEEEPQMNSLIDWVSNARRIAPFEDHRMPVIYVIGPGRSLAPEEMHIVNDELASTGAYFFSRPDYRASFAEAMKSLCEQLQQQYDPREKMDAWRRKQQAAEAVGSHS